MTTFSIHAAPALDRAPAGRGSGSGGLDTSKVALPGMSRVVSPAQTLARFRPLCRDAGITRVANITGLDRIGIPVVAVMRPNARSYAVAQGKGVTLDAAIASGLMESLENWHAEEALPTLRFGSFRDLTARARIVQLDGLPRVASSTFTEDRPILWAEGAYDLVSGEPTLVPYELVHLDFRQPRPPGSGAFLASSNGLASGNHALEALCHGLCELIERDSNTIWQVSGVRAQSQTRIALDTIDDPTCRSLLALFDKADVDVIAWNTTTDIGVASVLCDVVDRNPLSVRAMPAVMGSGCSPSRRIALSRALTEAAQGRLTRISGSRDDLFDDKFDASAARRMAAATRRRIAEEEPQVSFSDVPNVEHGSVEEDVRWICAALQAAGLGQIVAMNLTRPDVNLPVARVVVPHLEAMREFPGYVLGRRGRAACQS